MTDWKTGLIKIIFLSLLLNSIYSYVKLRKNHYTEKTIEEFISLSFREEN